MHLYHCVDARSFRPLWTLEEMGLDYQLTVLPFPPRVHAKDYKQVNPLGTVPFFEDGATRMTESSAICHYLATRHGPSPLALHSDDDDYGSFLNWTYFSDATLTFPQTLVLRYARFEPRERRQPQVADDYSRWFLGRLRAVESALDDRQWLCAGRFTVADITIGYALQLASMLKLDRQFGPNVAAYWQRLQEREGFRRAKHAQQTGAEKAGVLRQIPNAS